MAQGLERYAPAGLDMTRREYALQQADAEIRRLILEGFGLFRIAELYDIPRMRYCTDMQAENDVNWQNLPEYIKAQGHGVITEGYLRERLADQAEALMEKYEVEVTWLDAKRA